MAVQDDINSFINKAKQATVVLGMNLLSAQQNGQNELARHDIWLINKLSSAIIGLTNPNSFTTGEIYSIISYYNNLANLNPLGIAYINPTSAEYLIENKYIFVPGGGTYLLAQNNLSDVQNRVQARINLGLQIGVNVQAWSQKLDNFSNLANAVGVLQNDGSGNFSWAAALTNSLTSGNIFVGNASNVASAVSVSGDASLSNSGVLSVNKFNGQLPSYYLSTTNQVEGTNLFFTNARAINAPLTGYTSGAGTVSPSDSVLSAIEKLNGNISALVTGVSSFNTRTGAITLTSSDVTTALGFIPIQLSSLSGSSPISYNNTSGAISLTTVPITLGGTGQTTQQGAINALAGATTSGYYLRGNGTNVTMSAIQVSDVPTLNQNTTGTAANITATSNSTLTTLSSLSLPVGQVTGISATAPITYTSGIISATYDSAPTSGSSNLVKSGGIYTALTSGYLPINNPAYTGSLTTGTLGYTDTGILAALTNSTAGYNQLIIRNTSNGATSSSDVVVNNDQSTATTFYGDFGMNSSGFTGSPVFNKANLVYITATSGDLGIGTTTSNAIHFVVNNGNTDAMTISSAGLLSVANAATFSSGLSTNTISSVNTTLTLQPVAVTTGTNSAGNNAIIQGGLGTGMPYGAGLASIASYIIFQTPQIIGASNATPQTTYVNTMLLASGGISSGRNANYLWLGQSTGTATTSNYNLYKDSGGGFIVNDGGQLVLAVAGAAYMSFASNTITVSEAISSSFNIRTSATVQAGSVTGSSGNLSVTGATITTSNTAGGNLTCGAGPGNGTGTPSQILFTAPNIASSGVNQTASTIASMDAVNGNMFNSINTSQVTLIARGFGVGGSYTQTVDLQEWQTYNGTSATIVSKVDNNGKFWFLASTSGSASINMPNGATPSSPSTGDIWNDTTNVRLQGVGFALNTIGAGFRIKEGSNARMGTATLSGGTITVSNTSITSTTRIFITTNGSASGGTVSVTAQTAGTSFVLTSTNPADTRVINWILFEPA